MTIERFRAICEANPYLWLRKTPLSSAGGFLVENLYWRPSPPREVFWESEIAAMTPEHFYDRMFCGVNEANKRRFLRIGFDDGQPG